MTTLMIILFCLSFGLIASHAIMHIDAYMTKSRQGNNYVAVGHRNKAVLYGILCILFIIAFTCNRKEFHISNNQFINYPMSEQTNATTADNQSCPWVVNEHGSTIARVNSKTQAGILPLSFMLLFGKQCTRVKAVRFSFEKGKYKTFVTRTYAIKSIPAIEQYLS
jgi:hypothetical protein